jgi:hypothetical protein
MTPISYFNDVWLRCDEIGQIYSTISSSTLSTASAEELLRAEWVARVSALDLYIHELVVQNMLNIFDGTRPVCPGFRRFECSGETLLRIKAASSLDARAAFDLEVRNKLGRITFQFPEAIADGVRFISDCELWNEIALAKGASSATKTVAAKSLKISLSLIAERRNKIAHEGDLQPTVPRTPWPIGSSDVRNVAIFIEDLVRTIDKIV